MGIQARIKKVIIEWFPRLYSQRLRFLIRIFIQIQTKDCTLQESACKYEEDISDFFKLKNDEFPRFDLILLGLGLDGHTSSLFPGNAALLATAV